MSDDKDLRIRQLQEQNEALQDALATLTTRAFRDFATMQKLRVQIYVLERKVKERASA